MSHTVGFQNLIRLFAVALGASALGACAQALVASNKSQSSALSRHETIEKASVASIPNRAFPASHPSRTEGPAYGLASYYREGKQTASGEAFDPHQLTAAHRSLPFGTRLRVTNVATRRSVIVRVNDRGPFVHGRVVDVSYAAAETLGLTGRGVAKVKLDVLQ